ncbi:MAG: hypothetical protein JRJ56_03165 [Deltaproteobacteria bacterium]|nr:hypothetical protein [Deltaproteobacteria bacterium]
MVDLSVGGIGQTQFQPRVSQDLALTGPRLAPELLGQELPLEVVAALPDGRYLVKIAGRELVAAGETALAAGRVYQVQVTRVDPSLAVRLLPVGEAGLNFPGLGAAVATLLREPNAFAGRLLQLGRLLPAVEAESLAGLRQLVAELTAAGAEMPATAGRQFDLTRLPATLGLALEAGLAAGSEAPAAGLLPLLLTEPGQNLKAELLKARSWLSRREPTAATGELKSLVQDLLAMVELNQVLNNPGVRPFAGLQLVLPFFPAAAGVDVWLRVERRSDDEAAASDPALAVYSLVVYLELAAFGPVSSRVVADFRRLAVTVEVSGRRQLELLQEELAAVKEDLQSRFAVPVHFRLQQKPGGEIRSGWWENFSAGLPRLVNTRA